jgi:hypothetical protein
MSYLNSIVLPLEIVTLLAALALEIFRPDRFFRKSIYAMLAAAWTVAVMFRPWGASPDDWNYIVHLRLTYPLSEAEFQNTLGHSPLYYFLLSAVRVFQDGHMAFMAIAGAALALKFYIIGRITSFSVLALLGYASMFWMLHDVVQLRAGAATLFLFLVIHLWSQEKKAATISAAIVGPFIHISAMVSLAGIPLRWLLANRYWLALAGAALSQVLAELGLVPPSSIIGLVGISNERATLTIETATDSGGLRATSIAILFALAMAVPGLKLQKRPELDLAFYTVIAGFFVYWLTADVATVSSRLLQFLAVPVVLLASCYKQNAITLAGFIAICVASFYLSGWINGLMSFGGKWGVVPLP